MRAACSFVLCLCFTLASSGATPTDRDEIDATIERAWSPWARPVDLDELADVDRRHIPYLLQRAAEERGAGGGELRSRMLYSAINRRAPEIFPFLLEHTSTTANPWTADGVARLSPPQVARLLELLAHTEEAVVRRVADALGQILYDDPALAARLARAHRGPLVDLLSAPSERVLHPVAALLARAAPPPAEAASTLVSRMRSSDEHERATAAQAFATLGIPDASAAIPLASILLHDDYSAAAEDAAVKVGQPAMRALLGRIEERSLVGRLAILRAFARHGVCDLTDWASLQAFFDSVDGPIDHLVLVALDRDNNDIRDFRPDDSAHTSLMKNVGYATSVHYALPKLAADGSVLMFSGLSMWRPFPGSTTISMANAGVVGLATSLAVQIAPVRVNVITPGVVGGTDAVDNADPVRAEAYEAARQRTPGKRLPTPDNIVDASFALMDNRGINAANLVVDSAMHTI